MEHWKLLVFWLIFLHQTIVSPTDTFSIMAFTLCQNRWPFHLVWVIWLCSNFVSLCYKHLLWNYKLNSRLAMSAFAMVNRNTLLEDQLVTRIMRSSSFMFPLPLLTVSVQNIIHNSLLTILTTSWQSLEKIGWSE